MHLKFFCDAVLYNSISEAAKKNFVTQSTVSQAILKLEKIIGVSLVAHSRQKFQLTDEGRVVFDQSQYVFNAVDEIYDKLNHDKEKVSGLLKFITTNSLGMSFIAPMYKQVQKALPEVKMSFEFGTLTQIRNALRREEAEFAIVVYDHNFTGFSQQLLKKGSFQLYHHKEAPLQLIKQGIFVDFAKGSYIEELLSHASLKIQNQVSGWETVARFADLGLGVGFLPDYIVSNKRYPNLKKHPIKIPVFEYQISAIYNKGKKLSRAASAFLAQFLGSDLE